MRPKTRRKRKERKGGVKWDNEKERDGNAVNDAFDGDVIASGKIDSILFDSYARYLKNENFSECFPDGMGLFSSNYP